MSSQKEHEPKDQLLEHDYDGIQEFNNGMPPLLRWIFIITITVSIIYLINYHVLGTGDSMIVEYKKEMDSTYQKQPEDEGKTLLTMLPAYSPPYHREYGDVTQASLASFKPVIPDTTATAIPEVDPLTAAADIAAGKTIFMTNCIACHAPDGGGGIGPNLTDDYWLHGGKFPQIVNTITKGVPAKGMIQWEKSLKPSDILKVASYVRTLHGTTPANPKAPQGVVMTYTDDAKK